MHRSLALAAMLLAWSGAAQAQTRPPVIPEAVSELQGPVTVTNSSWISPPQPEFPPAASAHGLTSETVDLICIATVEGRVADCEVKESEPGFGFGEAALTSLADARLEPRTVNGVPVESAFGFRILFLLRDGPPPGQPEGASGLR